MTRASPRLVLLAVSVAVASVLALPGGAPAASNSWLAQRFIDFAHQGGEDEFPSNTLYAMKTSIARGADMLELDVGYTRDGKIVVLHDNRVERTTSGSGSVNKLTLAQVQRLDAAYWFVPGRNAVKGLPSTRYRWRGVRTGARRPPTGFTREDFRVPTLAEVLEAFPHTPMNVEIKGRDGSADAVYFRGADQLAKLLNRSGRRDVIVVSFNQKAVDRFHREAPKVPLAPGTAGVTDFFLGAPRAGPGTVALQVPITYVLNGQKITVTSPAFVKRAHEAGYAVHVWLSDDPENDATYKRLLDMCVDGIMAARPERLERVLRKRDVTRPGRAGGADPCGTRVPTSAVTVDEDRVTIPLHRAGLSLERRRGTVTLRASGATIGTARFALPSNATITSAEVRLTAVGRRALAAAGSLKVVAQVDERVPASRRRLTLFAG